MGEASVREAKRVYLQPSQSRTADLVSYWESRRVQHIAWQFSQCDVATGFLS